MNPILRRYVPLLILLVLLALNGLRLWREKRPPGARLAASDHGWPSAPNAEMRLRHETMMQRLPPEERQALQKRMESDRIFFASIANLPPEERQKKIQEHFADAPRPFPLMGAGGNADSLPKAFGDGMPPRAGHPMRIPPASVRRALDQQIANRPPPN